MTPLAGAMSPLGRSSGRVLAPLFDYTGPPPRPSMLVTGINGSTGLTITFAAQLLPADGGTHIMLELSPDVNSSNGFFMLSESEFGVPNVLEFCSKPPGVNHDIATCPRPPAGQRFQLCWVIDRTLPSPCHRVYIDGVKQTMTSQPGYTNAQNGEPFQDQTLYIMGRAGGQIPAYGYMSAVRVLPYAVSDADGEALST